MSSLFLLSSYSSSESDEEEERTIKKRLPPPTLPQNLSVPRSIVRTPAKSVHEGKRIRNFSHEAGNWATYLAVPVNNTQDLDSFIDSLKGELAPTALDVVDDFHISLTRVLSLRHHWINGFIDSSKSIVSNCEEFTIFLQGLSIFTNDEKTRTFVALDVRLGNKNLDTLVDNFDEMIAEYGLPKFYDSRKFHMSILWTLGDLKIPLQEKLQYLSKTTKDFSMIVSCNILKCKTGNKIFQFQLSNSH